jgi:hypothetical protein
LFPEFQNFGIPICTRSVSQKLASRLFPEKVEFTDSLLQKAEAQISDMYYHFYPGGRGVFGMPSADMEKNITWSYQGDSLFLNYEISEGDSATGLYLIKTLDSNRLILSEEVADFGSVTYYLSTN